MVTSPAELRADPGPQGTGYDSDFLGEPLPGATPVVDDAVRVGPDDRPWLDYEHFSVMLSRGRRLARQVAWNIDVETLRDGDTVSRSGMRFRADPRIPADAQVLEDVYARNRLDRGHLARRADLLWGTDEQAARANRESFYFPNITPQMDSFNQSGKEGDWGLLENSLTDYLRETPLPRATVFGGPELADDDPRYRGVQVPLSFWKVLAYRAGGAPDGQLRARAFRVTQSLDGLEPITFDEHYVIHGLSLADLQERTGLRFADALLDADERAGEAGVRPRGGIVTDPFAIRW